MVQPRYPRTVDLMSAMYRGKPSNGPVVGQGERPVPVDGAAFIAAVDAWSLK
jgi:hypothetical protein